MTGKIKTPLDFAQESITDLTGRVMLLAACVFPGNVRPWRAPALSLARRLELDRNARQERLERVAVAPGEAPAPLDLEVMDQLVTVLDQAEALVGRVAVAAESALIAWGGPWAAGATGTVAPPSTTSVFADPRPTLAAIAELLPLAALANIAIVREVEVCCTDLIEQSDEALGLITDGQTLNAICPWCAGRTEAAPVGGVRTLRVRMLPGTEPRQTVVVCEGGACAPPDSDVGTWVRGRPAWRQEEWDWLAKRLQPVAS